jgi:ribonuclease E
VTRGLLQVRWSFGLMARRMLIDASHPEETRVAVVSGKRLEDFDYETSRKKQLKGNVYLAKVIRRLRR